MKNIKNFEEFLNEGSFDLPLMKVGDTMMVSQEDTMKPVKMKLVSIEYLTTAHKSGRAVQGQYSYKFQAADNRTQYFLHDDLAKRLSTGDGVRKLNEGSFDEASYSTNEKAEHYEVALGADIIKDKKLFRYVINVILDYVKNWESSDFITKRRLEKWLKVDAELNDDYDYLENLELTVDGFFEYYDPMPWKNKLYYDPTVL